MLKAYVSLNVNYRREYGPYQKFVNETDVLYASIDIAVRDVIAYLNTLYPLTAFKVVSQWKGGLQIADKFSSVGQEVAAVLHFSDYTTAKID